MYALFFFKQKTAYEMRISDWSSDVCSSDLFARGRHVRFQPADQRIHIRIAAGLDVAEILLRPTTDLAFEIIAGLPIVAEAHRSEERRVGQECVSKFSSRW